MADSTENNKNLDSYGVWVKRPPQDANTETSEASDFSDLDNMFNDTLSDPVVAEDSAFDSISDNDTTLSDEELSNITNDINLPEKDATIVPEDDIFDDLPNFNEMETENSSPAETSEEEEEFSIDDFGIGEETASTEETPSAEEPAFTEEANPFEDIAETTSDSDSIDEVSLDDFGFDIDAPEGSTSEPAVSSEPVAASESTETVSEGENEEISLDDFMDGGFTDPNPGAPVAESSTSDEISLDDFFDDDSSKEKEDDVTNDEALDIDLSFTENAENEVPTEEVATESDDFMSDDDMFSSGTEVSAPETTISDATIDFDPSATEEISLEDFGLDENSDDATAVAAGAAVNASADSEEVDLSDFGIDSDADETPVKQDVQAAKKKQVVDYDLAITDEDTVTSAPTAETVPDRLAEDTADVISELEQPVAANSTMVDNSILDQIMAELSGLKNQINSLKGEFEDLKNKESIPATEEPAMEEAKENTGFFDNNDDDETIALSGDELSNIMNTADFTETDDSSIDSADFNIPEENIEISETLPDDIAVVPENDDIFENTEDTTLSEEESEIVESSVESSIDEEIIEADTGLSMADESLEEPDMDNFETEDVNLPSVDDIAEDESSNEADSILVESSSTDLMNSVNDSTEQMAQMTEDISAPEADTMELDDVPLPEVDEIAEDVSAPASEDEIFQEQASSPVQDEIYNDIMTEDVEVKDGISEDNIDYLKDEYANDDIPMVSEDSSEGVTLSESIEAAEEPAEESDLPEDLKSDVKSVLLYMDQLLENLPEDKIMEFAKSEQFSTYKKLFSELGLS